MTGAGTWLRSLICTRILSGVGRNDLQILSKFFSYLAQFARVSVFLTFDLHLRTRFCIFELVIFFSFPQDDDTT